MALAAFFIGSATANAAFDKNLSVGAKGAEVMVLQEFLINQGYLQAGYATGNFLGMTESAVKAFQTANGIESIGIFGPKTRATANNILAQGTSKSASITDVSLTNNANLAAVGAAGSKTIYWKSQNFPAGANVSINLLKKTSSTPNTFELVRSLAKNIANTGSYVWSMQNGDTGTELYVEVTCESSSQFTKGCTSSGPVKVN